MSAPVNTAAPVDVPAETPAVVEPVVAKPEEQTSTSAAAVEPTQEVVPESVQAEAPVTDAPVAETVVPVTDAAAPTDVAATETAAAAPVAEETVTAEPTKAIDSGVLGYKAPGLIKSFKFSKKHFWLSEEAVSHEKLGNYLRGEKPDVAHPTAAWSSQTGVGLLYFAKNAGEKASPAGVLNLAEASDIEKQSPHEFSFKLHGHKHTFKAADDAERDGWYVSIEKAITEAKASKEGVVSSEGYKEALTHLAKPAVGAATTGAAANKNSETPRIEEPARTGSSSSSSSEDAAAKKKSQSRSASRNKRASVFGNFLNKKEGHDVKKDIKKEEKEEAKEEAKEEKEEAKEEVEEPIKVDEPVEQTEAPAAVAPLDAEAVAARTVDAPIKETIVEPSTATEVPTIETPKEEARPKPNKRTSLFGSFFEKVRSPTHEKKDHDFAPIVPPKDSIVSAEPPVIPEPSTSTTVESPASPVAAEPLVAAAPAPAPAADEAAAPRPEVLGPRKESFFGGMMNKVRAKSPANVDRALAQEPRAVTPPKAEETIPTTNVEESTVDASAPTNEAPVLEEPTGESAAKPTTPKESRRKSYFGGGNKISSMFRKPSQAIRNKDNKKENVVPSAEENSAAVETPAAAPAETLEVPATTEHTAAETKVEEPQSIGNVGPESTTVGQEHKSNPAVSASA